MPDADPLLAWHRKHRDRIARWQILAELLVVQAAVLLVLVEAVAGALTRGPA